MKQFSNRNELLLTGTTIAQAFEGVLRVHTDGIVGTVAVSTAFNLLVAVLPLPLLLTVDAFGVVLVWASSNTNTTMKALMGCTGVITPFALLTLIQNTQVHWEVYIAHAISFIAT